MMRLCSRQSILTLFELIHQNATWRSVLSKRIYGEEGRASTDQWGVVTLTTADRKLLNVKTDCTWTEKGTRSFKMFQPHLIQQLELGQSWVKFEFPPHDTVMIWRSPMPPMPFPNHSMAEVYRIVHPQFEGVGYGCWFYPLHAPFSRGTGIFLNVGRTLVLQNRAEAERLFRRVGQRDDSLWALSALERGFDTVQLLHGPFGMPEMISCRESCLTQARPIRTCPPIPLFTGPRADRVCHCSEASHILNCVNSVAQPNPMVLTRHGEK